MLTKIHGVLFSCAIAVAAASFAGNPLSDLVPSASAGQGEKQTKPKPKAKAKAKPAADTRPTAAFRAEHAEVKEHLRHVHEWVGALPGEDAKKQKQTAEKVVTFFAQHIEPHAAWEEKHLYPVVDRLAGAGANAFTSTMRHEHTIVARWIAELREESARPTLDAVKFARRADNLLGLLWAHFEEEEEVLLPFIDKGMSKKEFERELGDAARAH